MVIRDGMGTIIADVEEYDARTGSVTRYLHDKDGKRIVNDIGRHVTYRTRRPKPLVELTDPKMVVPK